MLKSARITLRRVRTEDAEDIFAIYGDAETMAYWSDLPDENLAVSRRRAEILSQVSEPISYFGIEHSGRLIGNVGVYDRDEIGFILNRAYWRQGLMREALELYIPYAFETFAFPRITADVDPRNSASIALLEGFGFEQTGAAKNTLCVGDTWVDSVYFALQRPS